MQPVRTGRQRSGAADWHAFARLGRHTGASLGGALAWVATDSLAVHASLRRLQRHSVCINGGAPVSGISTINDEQAAVMAALKLRKPSQDAQMSLL